MSLRRRNPPVGLTLARRFTGILCFCSNRFFLSQRSNTSAAKLYPTQHTVCLRALHNTWCGEVLWKRFPVSASSRHRELWGSLWRTRLACTHKNGTRAGPRLHSSRVWNAPGRNLSLSSPSFSCSLLMLPLSFSLSLTVSAITSHTRFFGKPPF